MLHWSSIYKFDNKPWQTRLEEGEENNKVGEVYLYNCMPGRVKKQTWMQHNQLHVKAPSSKQQPMLHEPTYTSGSPHCPLTIPRCTHTHLNPCAEEYIFVHNCTHTRAFLHTHTGNKVSTMSANGRGDTKHTHRNVKWARGHKTHTHTHTQ